MQRRGAERPARQDEVFERPDNRVQLINNVLERLDVPRLDLRQRELLFVLLKEAEIRPEVEQLVLNHRQQRREPGGEAVRERDANRGVQLVDGAVRGDAR